MNMRCCMIVLIFASSTACVQQKASRLNSGDENLPPEFAQILRNYEIAWRARDAAGLANLFAEDGFVLSSNSPPVRGRTAIELKYAGAGGPLHLRALAWERERSIGYIIGEYSHEPLFANPGKFTLTLKKNAKGAWFIMSDMDNGNAPPLRP